MVICLNLIIFVGYGEEWQAKHAACGLSLDQQSTSDDRAHMQCKMIIFVILAIVFINTCETHWSQVPTCCISVACSARQHQLQQLPQEPQQLNTSHNMLASADS